MQGVFINYERTATKKRLRLACQDEPETVTLEATSVFGDEYDGPISEAPDGSYYVVGPDPYTSRNWYATISVGGGEAKVS